MTAHDDKHEELLLDFVLGGEAGEVPAREVGQQISSCDACQDYGYRLLWDLPAIAAAAGAQMTEDTEASLEALSTLLESATVEDQAGTKTHVAEVIPFRRLKTASFAAAFAAAAALAIWIAPIEEDGPGIKTWTAGALTLDVKDASGPYPEKELGLAISAAAARLEACRATGSVRLTVTTDGLARTKNEGCLADVLTKKVAWPIVEKAVSFTVQIGKKE